MILKNEVFRRIEWRGEKKNILRQLKPDEMKGLSSYIRKTQQ